MLADLVGCFRFRLPTTLYFGWESWWTIGCIVKSLGIHILPLKFGCVICIIKWGCIPHKCKLYIFHFFSSWMVFYKLKFFVCYGNGVKLNLLGVFDVSLCRYLYLVNLWNFTKCVSLSTFPTLYHLSVNKLRTKGRKTKGLKNPVRTEFHMCRVWIVTSFFFHSYRSISWPDTH